MDALRVFSGGTRTEGGPSIALCNAIVDILRRHQYDEQKPKLIAKDGKIVCIARKLET